MSHPVNAVTRRARLHLSDAMLVVAVLVSGGAAGAMASHAIWLATPAVAFMVWWSCRQKRSNVGDVHSMPAAGAPAPLDYASVFPQPLSDHVAVALRHVPAGEARQRLLVVLQQVRPWFVATGSPRDDAGERAARDQVTALVTVACGVALELARLDGVTLQHAMPDDAALCDRIDRARQELVTALDEAAHALGALGGPGCTPGPDSVEAVATLAAGLHAHAKPRSAAVSDMIALLPAQ